jgi:predicted anti-sigma-YlaC factor YlaD
VNANGNCTETLAELERFLDKELPPEKVEAVMTHLGRCTDCQGAYEFHSELSRVVRIHAQDDTLDPGFAARLRSCFALDANGEPGGSRG